MLSVVLLFSFLWLGQSVPECPQGTAPAPALQSDPFVLIPAEDPPAMQIQQVVQDADILQQRVEILESLVRQNRDQLARQVQ